MLPQKNYMRAMGRTIGIQMCRHWALALAAAFAIGVLFMGSSAWAAPVQRPLNQTVPRPTPTSSGGAVATATPQPDQDDDGDDDGDDSDNDGGSGGSNTGGDFGDDAVDPGVELFPGESDESEAPAEDAPAAGGAPAASNLTANVTVANLNVREGPSTSFNVLGNYDANAEVTVRSRNEDGSWWYVCCLPNSETAGWVSAQLLSPNFERSEANDLIPVFGAEPTPVPQTDSSSEGSQQDLPQAEEPLAMGFQLDPPFVWQGMTATLTISVTNPNAVDAVNVRLSDEIPIGLALVDTGITGGGRVVTETTDSGQPLVFFGWDSIPAQTGAIATLEVRVDEDLQDGLVIDNLAAVRARNAPYSSGAITIGLPPQLPPHFE